MINVSQRQYSSRPIAGPSSAAETSVARKFFVRRAEIQERKLILLLLERSKVTIKTINRMYKDGEPISVMTAQDYPSGMMVDRAGIDVCLVGDSLAMVALGYDSTNPLTVDVRSPPASRYLGHDPITDIFLQEMLHHCRAVARGCKSAFLVADLPYGSYEASPDDAVRVSLRFLKEGNVEVCTHAIISITFY